MNYELSIKKILNQSLIKNHKSLIIILASCFLLLASAPLTHANAQGVDLGIYPPIIQVETTPPADVKVPIYLENFTDQSVELNIFLKPFQSTDNENGQIDFIDNPQYSDLNIAKRIVVLDNNSAIDSLILSPKQQKNLTLKFNIPQDEPKGDYYLSLIFASNGQNLNNSNFSKATGGVASNILLTVGPIGKTQGLLEDFSTFPLVSKGPVPFNVRLRNTSNHYISPTGDILITNMFGQTIGKVTLLQVNVLSNSVRRIPDKLQSGANDKDYAIIKPVVEKNKYPVAVWPEKFLLGAYKADLTVSLFENGPVFKKTVWFFAFPIEYLLGILLIIGIVVFIIIRVKRKMV
jgi:hypothetical protein